MLYLPSALYPIIIKVLKVDKYDVYDVLCKSRIQNCPFIIHVVSRKYTKRMGKLTLIASAFKLCRMYLHKHSNLYNKKKTWLFADMGREILCQDTFAFKNGAVKVLSRQNILMSRTLQNASY